MYKKCIPYVIIVVLAIGLIATYNRGSNIRLDYQKAIANMKAYDAIIGQNKGDMRALQLNIDQLM